MLDYGVDILRHVHSQRGIPVVTSRGAKTEQLRRLAVRIANRHVERLCRVHIHGFPVSVEPEKEITVYIYSRQKRRLYSLREKAARKVTVNRECGYGRRGNPFDLHAYVEIIGVWSVRDSCTAYIKAVAAVVDGVCVI